MQTYNMNIFRWWIALNAPLGPIKREGSCYHKINNITCKTNSMDENAPHFAGNCITVRREYFVMFCLEHDFIKSINNHYVLEV